MESPIFIFQKVSVNYSGLYFLLLSMEMVKIQGFFPSLTYNFYYLQFLIKKLIHMNLISLLIRVICLIDFIQCIMNSFSYSSNPKKLVMKH